MSLEELSARSGISPTPLSKLERGKSNATIMTLFRVACALEVPLATIVDVNMSYMKDATDALLSNELMRYIKRLNPQQKIDVIAFLRSISEWDQGEKPS